MWLAFGPRPPREGAGSPRATGASHTPTAHFNVGVSCTYISYILPSGTSTPICSRTWLILLSRRVHRTTYLELRPGSTVKPGGTQHPYLVYRVTKVTLLILDFWVTEQQQQVSFPFLSRPLVLKTTNTQSVPLPPPEAVSYLPCPPEWLQPQMASLSHLK